MNLTCKTATPEPNRQFILDLQSWIQDLHENGHQVILNLDNNEDLYASDGRVQPIPYCPNDVASCTAQDGSLATLAVSCGLIDILGLQHSSRPFPPTYIRGHKQIDYMLISPSLQHMVIRSGILPYNSLFTGDYRPCFLDFDANQLFSGPTAPLAPPCQRGLQLHDPRKTTKYREILHEQLQYHKVFEKYQDLLQAAQQKLWSPEYTLQYNRLDAAIMEAMLHAERSCSKKYTKIYKWSPTMILAVEEVQF
jgi:hypothetical protein